MIVVTQEFELRGHRISLKVAQEFFLPNKTTRLFSQAVQVNPDDVVLDIGSGVGPLALWAGREPSKEVHAVEIVPEQYSLLCDNIRENKLEHKVFPYRGAFFDPLPQGVKGDVIIADVSGIAEGPARALGWYPTVVPTGGDDGTEVIIPLLQRAADYLKPQGRVYFPIAIGLSDTGKIMNVARQHFKNLEKKIDQVFPLGNQEVELLAPFLNGDRSYMHLETRRSRKLWRGHIYEATSPVRKDS